jgi:hypothetical protein
VLYLWKWSRRKVELVFKLFSFTKIFIDSRRGFFHKHPPTKTNTAENHQQHPPVNCSSLSTSSKPVKLICFKGITARIIPTSVLRPAARQFVKISPSGQIIKLVEAEAPQSSRLPASSVLIPSVPQNSGALNSKTGSVTLTSQTVVAPQGSSGPKPKPAPPNNKAARSSSGDKPVTAQLASQSKKTNTNVNAQGFRLPATTLLIQSVPQDNGPPKPNNKVARSSSDVKPDKAHLASRSTSTSQTVVAPQGLSGPKPKPAPPNNKVARSSFYVNFDAVHLASQSPSTSQTVVAPQGSSGPKPKPAPPNNKVARSSSGDKPVTAQMASQSTMQYEVVLWGTDQPLAHLLSKETRINY